MKDFFKTVLTFVYNIFNALNLVPALFISLVGLVLYVTGTFESYPVVMIIFQLLLIVCAIYAIVATTRKLFGLDKRVKKSKGMQIVSENSDGEKINKTTSSDSKENADTVSSVEKPKYYKLKQNPDYMMAEYQDRYELFLITNEGLKKIRTDYK